MNRIRGSVFTKTAAIFLLQIFVLIIAITTFIGTTYWNYEDSSFDILEQDTFTETSYYKQMVEDNIYNLLDYIKYCDKFELNGTYNPDKIVDIYDYNQNDRITNKVTISIGYTIEQLLSWKQHGFTYHTGLSDNTVFDSGSAFSDELGLPSDTDTTIDYLEEQYSNTSNIPLLQYAREHNINYNDLCSSIENAAHKLETEIIDYKTQISSFKENNTNLRYAIMDNNNQTFYTNLPIANIQDGINQITQLGSYVLLDATNADFNSNIFYAKGNLNRYLNSLYLNSKNCTLVIGVDTTFPALDNFHKENQQYTNMEGWFSIFTKLLIISIIGSIGCLFFLSAAAGHQKNTAILKSTAFEKIKTEFLFILVILPEGFLYYRLSSIYSNFSLPSVSILNLTKAGILVASMNIIFTIGYLSFLRRLKLGTLLSNSLLYLFFEFIKEFSSHWKISLKMLFIYITFFSGVIFSLLITNRWWHIILLSILFVVFGGYLIAEAIERQKIIDGIKKIAAGNLEFQINTQSLHRENKILGDAINEVSKGLQQAIEKSVMNERMKTDLITNVSHDIKTPLTSIINYVTLLKRIPTESIEAKQYITILEEKSHRLKHLTEDLVEASKISSGNIDLHMEQINFVELIHQSSGEFEEIFQHNHLTLITSLPDAPLMIMADGRRIWRVIENIYNNANKYSQSGTRVYADLTTEDSFACFTIKNISAQQLNIKAEELTKRFIRGDISRSTEGSGLGLSIAKNLTELQGGIFTVYLDGDLFRVTIKLPLL